jgi:hypothetical protein
MNVTGTTLGGGGSSSSYSFFYGPVGISSGCTAALGLLC